MKRTSGNSCKTMRERYSRGIGKPDRGYGSFRREYVFLPLSEWEKIDVPAVERRLNFHPEQVKIVKDMEKHITYFHRIQSQDF